MNPSQSRWQIAFKVLATLGIMGVQLASASPSLQTCDVMEIRHTSDAGASYGLNCRAGRWRLEYSGAIPAGNEPMDVQYRLTVTGPAGAAFTYPRKVRVASPALMGQTLAREAVLLDSGDLALRECPEIGCSQYRPMAAGERAKATVTVTPEIKQLTAERDQLNEQILALKAELHLEVAKSEKLKSEAAGLRQSLTEEKVLREQMQLARDAEMSSSHSAEAKLPVKALPAPVARDDGSKRIAQLQKSINELEKQVADYKKAMADLEHVNRDIFSVLAATRAELAALKQKLNETQASKAEPAASPSTAK